MTSQNMSLAAWVILAALAGCAGNGVGLDANGRPIGSEGGGTEPLTADFQSIQDNVFTPICTRCHIGASAPEGLQLDAAHSYDLLVGVPSAEEPSLLRVKPGDPDNSYIILKLQGSPGIVGAQMPFGGPYLPQSTIDVIRQWITNGALKAQSQSMNAKLESARAFTLTQTLPADGAVVAAPLRTIVLAFNHEVDASLVNGTTLRLERVGDGDANAEVAVAFALAPGNPEVIILRPRTALGPGRFRVSLRGTGGVALADVNAQALGDEHSFTFTVDPAP